MTEEVWLPVAGYEGIYEVSNLGAVKRIKAAQGTKTGLLKPKMTKGYLYVSLCRNGLSRAFRVNRLVCRAFHGEPAYPEMEANHLDGVKTNNAARNLEWSTHAENNLHKTRVLGSGAGKNHCAYGKYGALNRSAKAYVVIGPSGIKHEVMGLNEFCRRIGLSASAMCKIAQKGEGWHKGFSCRYVSD